MKREQIARLWNESGLTTIHTAMFDDLTEFSQSKVESFVKAIEAQVRISIVQIQGDVARAARANEPDAGGAAKALDIMMRTYGAAVAWRDKYKIAKGHEVFALMLVELCTNVMDAVGWHPTGEYDKEPGTVKLVAAPAPALPVQEMVFASGEKP
jgi:hypothetical protein